MKLPLFAFLISFLFLSSQAQESDFPYTLTLMWETAPVLKTVESVIFDPKSGFIYTANIHGHFMAKDGNGFLSKLALDGSVVEEQWVKGLDAPTGLGIYQGKLYTTDIDKIVEIDISSGTILHTYPVSGAKAFNDVAIGPDGTVYCSDTGGDQVFSLTNGTLHLFAKDIPTPNGIIVQKDGLLLTRWNPKDVVFLDFSRQNTKVHVQGIQGPDGLEQMEDGSYLLSSFHGVVYHVSKDGDKTRLLDTRQAGIKAADIDYIAAKKWLLVPTMDTHKVMAYQLVKK
ncbi:MAG: hypothetical protein AAF587_38965 [Bacteroidota bacterium]